MQPSPPFDPASVHRPDPRLMKYYFVTSLLTFVGAVIAIPVLYCRYITLEYHLDDEGISMRWGVLFRREVQLTYRRIQDIHLTRNIIQRWFGLATVSVQTAAGAATPEMQIEGVLEAEALRDYLYRKMRGAHDEPGTETANLPSPAADEATELLRSIRDNLATLAKRGGGAA